MGKKKDNHYLEEWYSTVHYYGEEEPCREFLIAEDQLRGEFKKYQVFGTAQYGDKDGDQIIASEKYKQAVELEQRRKEKIRKKKWINPITNEVSAAEYDLDTTIDDEDVYAYNRERRLDELNDEYDIAKRIIDIKRYILQLKEILQDMVDNPPSAEEIEENKFAYMRYQLDCYSYQSEIFEWEKRLEYYMDPVVGYNVKIIEPVPSEEEYKEQLEQEAIAEEKAKSWTEKLMDKFNAFSERYIDPIIKGFKKFLKRNEKQLTYIFKVAFCITAIGVKVFGG